jgi:hypothetical protein
MTLLERLQSHKGSLIRLKSQLFWYGGRGWDGETGRVCLILDADLAASTAAAVGAVTAVGVDIAALLLIDGAPRWIWVAEVDVEVIDDPS